VRKPCCRFGKASPAGVAPHHPSAGAQPREAPDNRDPRPAPHPRKQASLHRKARASSRTREALRYQDASRVRKLCFRFGKASPAGVAHHHPSAQAQPREAPDTAIHAERPTPGSKLPSATKREQALALEKRCRYQDASRVREALLPLWQSQPCWRRAPPPQRCEPNHGKLPPPRSTPSAPPQEASFPPPQSESKLSHSRSAQVPRRF
jgi:hypothetical protein